MVRSQTSLAAASAIIDEEKIAVGMVEADSIVRNALRRLVGEAPGFRCVAAQIARKVMQSFREPGTGTDTAPTLSEREEEMLRSLSNGHSKKEIAGKLSLSARIVRIHPGRIYEKLRVRSCAEG